MIELIKWKMFNFNYIQYDTHPPSQKCTMVNYLLIKTNKETSSLVKFVLHSNPFILIKGNIIHLFITINVKFYSRY